MLLKTLFVSAAVASVASADMVVKRAPATNIDGVVLNFALTLEHLEAAFYKQGLSKYSAKAFAKAGYPSWVRKRVTEIASHEADHVNFLSTALTAAGVTPVKACTYDFGVRDVKSFLAVAQVLEGVGVSAYSGAAQLITDPAYLTAAATVLTVEARHNAFIRSDGNGGDPFPSAYDVPLGPMAVFSLAAPFIKSCPENNPVLPFTAFPALTVAVTKKSSVVKVSYKGAAAGDFIQFIGAAGATAVPYSPKGVKVPKGLTGQVYIVITKTNATPTDATIVAGPAIIDIDVPAQNFKY